MKYYTYIDQSGKTLFFESLQKERKFFVGIFELSQEQTLYSRYNGTGIEKDYILYEKFISENVDEQKKRLTSIILSEYNKSIFKLKESYPSEEISGWDYKSMQANNWINSSDKQSLIDNDSVLILKNESDGTIEGITALATRVIDNSKAYQTIYGKNTKKYKELLHRVSESSTIEDLNIIKGEIIYD